MDSDLQPNGLMYKKVSWFEVTHSIVSIVTHKHITFPNIMGRDDKFRFCILQQYLVVTLEIIISFIYLRRLSCERCVFSREGRIFCHEVFFPECVHNVYITAHVFLECNVFVMS